MKKYVVLEDTSYFSKGDIVYEIHSKYQEINVGDKEIYPTIAETIHWSLLKRVQ